jgi:hypothetical protein
LCPYCELGSLICIGGGYGRSWEAKEVANWYPLLAERQPLTV